MEGALVELLLRPVESGGRDCEAAAVRALVSLHSSWTDDEGSIAAGTGSSGGPGAAAAAGEGDIEITIQQPGSLGIVFNSQGKDGTPFIGSIKPGTPGSFFPVLTPGMNILGISQV